MSNVYRTHPLTCAPDDYQGQVRRTIGGRPVPDEQVDRIVDGVAGGLALEATDRLLDLCCGNGALTTRWFARCAGGLGVDSSEPLIEVANRDFADPPGERFALGSVLDFAREPERFTDDPAFDKAVCFASLQYLPRERVEGWLTDLRRNLRGLRRLWLGNLPDRNRVDAFRAEGVEVPLDDPGSDLGCWWGPAELCGVARAAGWHVEVHRPVPQFYQAHYRIDALLIPREHAT